MLGVLYHYVWQPLLAISVPIYNTQRRGLAELLILIKGQCEGLIGEISDRKFTPAPFLFPELYINQLRQGERVGRIIIMDKFTDKEIVNFNFFKRLPGVYCYKTDFDENIIAYAYISSSYKLLITNDLNSNEHNIYEWNSNDSKSRNEDIPIICEFLGELALRPLLKQGTPYEQKLAKSLWQLYIPQSTIPEKLKQIAKNLLMTNTMGIH